ncbi:hypothetical protein MASR2M66_04220 [Chloroflexota bacterium]
MTEKNNKDRISTGDNSVVVGGSVSGSNIVVGNNNTTSNQIAQLTQRFEIIYRAVEESPTLKPADKEDVKAELAEIQTALAEPQPDESFLARRFRNVQRMAPEIMEVAFETLKNPISGVAEVIKRIAKRAAEDAGAKE